MLIRALKLQLADGATVVAAMEALMAQKWTSNVVNGQTALLDGDVPPVPAWP